MYSNDQSNILAYNCKCQSLFLWLSHPSTNMNSEPLGMDWAEQSTLFPGLTEGHPGNILKAPLCRLMWELWLIHTNTGTQRGNKGQRGEHWHWCIVLTYPKREIVWGQNIPYTALPKPLTAHRSDPFHYQYQYQYQALSLTQLRSGWWCPGLLPSPFIDSGWKICEERCYDWSKGKKGNPAGGLREELVEAEGNPVLWMVAGKENLCSNRSKQKVRECVFNVTVLGVKVQWRLWRVMFGIPHNCV